MKRYRSRAEIVAQILGAIANDERACISNKGISKTRIMFKAFLSYSQLNEYLSLLTQKEMIEFDQTTQTFKLTKKGHRFLMAYEELSRDIKL